MLISSLSNTSKRAAGENYKGATCVANLKLKNEIFLNTINSLYFYKKTKGKNKNGRKNDFFACIV